MNIIGTICDAGYPTERLKSRLKLMHSTGNVDTDDYRVTRDTRTYCLSVLVIDCSLVPQKYYLDIIGYN